MKAHQADLAIQSDEQRRPQAAWGRPEVRDGLLPVGGAQRRGRAARLHERADHPADEIYEVPVQA